MTLVCSKHTNFLGICDECVAANFNRSKLPAAVSEVDGGTEAGPKFYARCGYCERKWLALTNKETCPVCVDVPFEQKGSPYFDRLNHAEPVAPQGTVEGETPISYRKAGSRCLWCSEEMDHNCGYGACGNCCASLGNICHESPRGYAWLKQTVLLNIAKLAESVAPPSVAMQERETGYCPKGGPEMYVFYEFTEGLAPIPWEVYKVEDVERFRPVSGEGSGVPALDIIQADVETACGKLYETCYSYADADYRRHIACRERQLKAALSSPLQEGAEQRCSCRVMCSCKASENPHCHYCKAGM